MTNLIVSCVQRTANSVAHSLARFAKNIHDVIVWMEDSPLVALESLYLDSSWDLIKVGVGLKNKKRIKLSKV